MFYNIYNMFNLLKDNLIKSEIQIEDKKINTLVDFFHFLVEFNAHTNLTRITSEEDAVKKHFTDSLFGARFIPKNSKVCDIGSGGGFPSIPLSVYCEDSSFTLVDSTGKKVDFLNSAIEKLGINNARAIQGRAEEMGQDAKFRERFDVVTARAVASLPTLLEYCLPFVKVGGLFLAYKTSGEELEESKNALKVLGGKIKDCFSYSLGDKGESRTIFVIEKIASTPPKYPRGQGKPRSKPL